jgi:phage baseplate assembly protein W
MVVPDPARAFLGVGWAFPPRIDGAGAVAEAVYEDDVREAIRIILGTNPGERVMRPDFGSGLLALVFEPGGPELVAATQHLVQGALQQELGHLIAVESVEVTQDDGALSVSVAFVALQTQQRTNATFARSVP